MSLKESQELIDAAKAAVDGVQNERAQAIALIAIAELLAEIAAPLNILSQAVGFSYEGGRQIDIYDLSRDKT